MTQTEQIRKLNIASWRNPHMQGRLVLSRYVADRGAVFVEKCNEALAAYGWNADNDPHNKADFRTLEIDSEQVFAKLDYYDHDDQNFGSENLADPAKTLRIGTLMFPEEY